jgi:hypothetical protein
MIAEDRCPRSPRLAPLKSALATLDPGSVLSGWNSAGVAPHDKVLYLSRPMRCRECDEVISRCAAWMGTPHAGRG